MSQIEPLYARACSLRPDRTHTVVRRLEELHEASVAAADHPSQFALLARQFHEELVTSCGNQPFIVMVGALEALWSAQVHDAGEEIEFGALPELATREQSVAEHRELLDLIIAGDGAERSARRHQANPQKHSLVGKSIKVTARPLRSD